MYATDVRVFIEHFKCYGYIASEAEFIPLDINKVPAQISQEWDSRRLIWETKGMCNLFHDNKWANDGTSYLSHIGFEVVRQS